MTICADTSCDWFATDHEAEHPCGVMAENPGQPCRHCGREVLVGEEACPNCWVSVDGIEQDVAGELS